MLLTQTKSRFIFCSLILVVSTLVNGCNNSQQLAESIRPDPSLESSANQSQDDQSPDNQSSTNSKSNSPNKEGKNQQQQASNQASNSSKSKPNSPNSKPPTSKQRAFDDLPENLPFYPQADLKVISPQSSPEEGSSEWRSLDDPNTIVNYYQEKWESSNWKVVQPFRANQNKNGLEAVVRRDELDFTIDLAIAKPTAEDSRLETRLKISYQAAGTDDILASNNQQQKNSQPQDFQANNQDKQTAIPVKSSSSSASSPQVPEQLLSYVRDVVALGITDSPDLKNKANKAQFNPNETITRREYARWLFIANNIYYADVPGNKIRLASSSNDPVFKDIRVQDSDFEEIQGLAEAGVIPSILTNDSKSILFEPDEPLTREDLITWKVPLDTRRGLPKADASSIQEAWGFQDTSQIDILALRALFADYQNGDQSNLKRVFGYTTLFRPQKVVTKAEAAASLWYLGFQGDGISAQDKLKNLKSGK